VFAWASSSALLSLEKLSAINLNNTTGIDRRMTESLIGFGGNTKTVNLTLLF
jgi:hypothetical protein